MGRDSALLISAALLSQQPPPTLILQDVELGSPRQDTWPVPGLTIHQGKSLSLSDCAEMPCIFEIRALILPEPPHLVVGKV